MSASFQHSPERGVEVACQLGCAVFDEEVERMLLLPVIAPCLISQIDLRD